MTYSKEPELTLAEHTAYERGKSHALMGWAHGGLCNVRYNHQQWYDFGFIKGTEIKKKDELKALVLESP